MVLRIDHHAKIDAACDEFESQCKAGQSPLIEDFLDGFTEPARSELLRELLFIDQEYRRRQGDPPQQNEYLHRFPAQDELISQVLNSIKQQTLFADAAATLADNSPKSKPAVDATAQTANIAGSEDDSLDEA